MNHDELHLTPEESKEFMKLTEGVEQEMAQRAIDSWAVEPRPNPLEPYMSDTRRDAHGRRHVAPGHVAFTHHD